MEKIIILLLLVILSLSLIYLVKRLERKVWFKKIDRLIGIPIILVLIAWGSLEIYTGDASFFLINLKPLLNTTRQQNPELFWFYVTAKFYFAFLFIVMLRKIYRRRL